MAVQTEVVAVLGTLGGSIIGAVAGVAAAWINNKSADRKHMREIALQAAAKTWETLVQGGRQVPPLEHYLIHSALMVDIATDPKITRDEFRVRLQRVGEMVDELEAHRAVANKKAAAQT